jgi:hypothetical protein
MASRRQKTASTRSLRDFSSLTAISRIAEEMISSASYPNSYHYTATFFQNGMIRNRENALKPLSISIWMIPIFSENSKLGLIGDFAPVGDLQ